MTKEIDSQLRDFFRNEVEERKEPELHYGGSLPIRTALTLLSRFSLAAAAVLVFCITALLRPENPIDTLINPMHVEEAVGGVLQQGGLIMQIYLLEKK